MRSGGGSWPGFPPHAHTHASQIHGDHCAADHAAEVKLPPSARSTGATRSDDPAQR